MTIMNKKGEMKSLAKLIWIDLEMSGLSPENDVILEVAIVITDPYLNELSEPKTWAVYQPDSILNNMDSWNTSTHTKTGLIERCRHSKQDTRKVEQDVLKYLKKHIEKKVSPMCGNSICQDRRFLAIHMPQFEDYFHYRNLDVSSFKIVSQIYAPNLANKVQNRKNANESAVHSAVYDIQASIQELQIYIDELLNIESNSID